LATIRPGRDDDPGEVSGLPPMMESPKDYVVTDNPEPIIIRAYNARPGLYLLAIIAGFFVGLITGLAVMM